MQAMEAIKLVAGVGASLSGRLQVYDALNAEWRSVKVAKDAACAVLGADARIDLATKADIFALKTDLAELKVELIKWNVGAMAVLTAIFAAIVRLG